MRDDQDLTRVTEDQDRSTRIIMNCMDEYGMPLTACRRCIVGSYVIQGLRPRDRETFTGSFQGDSG
jgi:hypothetical protein